MEALSAIHAESQMSMDDGLSSTTRQFFVAFTAGNFLASNF
jgi:hypothetical protein